MSVIDKAKEIKETAEKLLSGILSNPNYNFENAKKAADIAVTHAQALVVKLAESVEKTGEKIAAVADKIGDKARGKDDVPKTPVAPVAPKVEDKPKDPLSGI